MSDLQISLYDFPSDLRDLMEMREEAEYELGVVNVAAFNAALPDDTANIDERRKELTAQIVEIDKGLALYYEALPKKVDDLGAAWKWLESLVGTSTKRGRIDQEIDRLKVRKATFEARLLSIKTMVQYVMEAMPWKPGKPRKLDGARHTIYLKGNGGRPAVEVYDESLVPDEFCAVEVKMPAAVWRAIAEAYVDTEGFVAECGPRVPSLSAIGEALAKPCPDCLGLACQACRIHARDFIETYKGTTKHICGKCGDEGKGEAADLDNCMSCGGTGRNSVAGARLKPLGQHVEVR